MAAAILFAVILFLLFYPQNFLMRKSASLRSATDEKEKSRRPREVETRLVRRINHERGAKLVPKTPRPGWRERGRWASRLGAPWELRRKWHAPCLLLLLFPHLILMNNAWGGGPSLKGAPLPQWESLLSTTH